MGKKEIYLSRRGNIFGPYDSSQLEKMRVSGELDRYSHRWDPAISSWQPIDPPPATAPQAQIRVGGSLEAVCHDSHHTLISGHLRNVSVAGCEFVTRDPAASPRLALRAPLVLNIWDSARRKSVDLQVRLNEVSREDHHWVYQVQWNRIPAELAA